MGTEAEILEKVADKTQSELILFFILVVVALVVVLIPLYRMVSKDRKERRDADAARVKGENEATNIRQDKYIEREKQIIQVITANTEVMAGLKATFETFGAATTSSFARIHERMDSHSAKLGEVTTEIAQIKTTLDRSISNQKDMTADIRKTLLIVDNMPHTSNFHADQSDKGTGSKESVPLL